MTKETGGPAFPSHASLGNLSVGMTLRDYFAGQFLMGNATHGVTDNDTLDRYLKKCSVMAYKIADAMIAARKDSDEAKAE